MEMSYYSLGDKLSDTDPISNSVLISGLRFSRDGPNVMRAGRYPIQCLNSYIHESLHHICFRTPVGNALAYLYYRAFQKASDYLALAGAADYDDYDVLDDVARVEAALHIMRPLAEGIALFGEFDAYPGEAKSLSSVFRNTAIAFAQIVPRWEDFRVDELLRGILDRARPRSATRLRKENLLMQGFTTKSGGYLPGYFLIKNLQFALIGHLGCRKFIDTDFFLNFIVHWFYGDFNLVKALLDSDKNLSPFTAQSTIEHDAINAISVAFQQRFSQLFTGLAVEQVEQFDDLLASPGLVPWWKIQIGMNSDEAKALEEKLIADCNRLIDFSRPGSREQRAFRSMCYDNMIRRNYMCVGAFEDDIEIRENGRVMIAEVEDNPTFPVMAFGNSEKAGPYKGRATIDVLQSGFSGRIFCAVYVENERVLLKSFADGFEEEQPLISSINVSTASCRTVKDFMRMIINSALKNERPVGIMRAHYKTESSANTETVYRNWCGALMTVVGPEADLSTERGALLELCEGDTKFLRTIAALGCVGTPIFDDTVLEETCQEQSLTTAEFWSRIKAVEKNHDLRLLYPIDRYWALTV